MNPKKVVAWLNQQGCVPISAERFELATAMIQRIVTEMGKCKQRDGSRCNGHSIIYSAEDFAVAEKWLSANTPQT